MDRMLKHFSEPAEHGEIPDSDVRGRQRSSVALKTAPRSRLEKQAAVFTQFASKSVCPSLSGRSWGTMAKLIFSPAAKAFLGRLTLSALCRSIQNSTNL